MKLYCSKCWILSRGLEGKVNSTLEGVVFTMLFHLRTELLPECLFNVFSPSRALAVVGWNRRYRWTMYTYFSVHWFIHEFSFAVLRATFLFLPSPMSLHRDEDNICLSDEANAYSMYCTCVFNPCQQSCCRLTEYILWMSY